VTGLPWIAAACVLAGALIIVIRPAGGGLRRLQGPAPSPAWRLTDLLKRLRDLGDVSPRRLTLLVIAGAAACGLLLGGPVAAVVAAVYGALVVRAVLRRAHRQRAAALRASSLDGLCALAADLRAGLPPAIAAMASDPFETSLAGPQSVGPRSEDLRPAGRGFAGSGLAGGRSAGSDSAGTRLADPRLAELTAAVWRLGELTGAPAADLIERIEADARAGDRAKATAAAEAAGAQATAMLLAALPLGGIALGYSIGADPLQVLLHTKLGAACAIGAVTLQCAGLLWCDRLVAGPAR
jgi:tight adherence protein B